MATLSVKCLVPLSLFIHRLSYNPDYLIDFSSRNMEPRFDLIPALGRLIYHHSGCQKRLPNFEVLNEYRGPDVQRLVRLKYKS